MRRSLALGAAALALLTVPAAAGTGYGQVTFVNQTSVTGDLYVDQEYGCRALAGLMCTTQVRAGRRRLEARFVDGEVVAGPEFDLAEGESKTFTVSEAPAE